MGGVNRTTIKKLLKVNFVYSAFINFRHFGLKGLLKMPIVIGYGSTFKCKSKGGISFVKKLRPNMLSIKNRNNICIEDGGKLICNGAKACFNISNTVSVSNKGVLMLGDNFFANTQNVFLVTAAGVLKVGNNFFANGPTEINCKKALTFGDDVLLSVHVIFLDTDYHPIFDSSGQRINYDREIIIGNKVWIGCNATVLKGSVIGNNIIVGAGAIVSGKLLSDHSIYGGNPIRILKSGVTWCP